MNSTKRKIFWSSGSSLFILALLTLWLNPHTWEVCPAIKLWGLTLNLWDYHQPFLSFFRFNRKPISTMDDQQQFCLRWNDFQTNMVSELYKCWGNIVSISYFYPEILLLMFGFYSVFMFWLFKPSFSWRPCIIPPLFLEMLQ